MTAQFVVGFDLGTTNSVVAYAPVGGEAPQIELLPIPQIVAPGTLESRTALPSFLYLAHEHETAQGVFDLPWAEKRDYVVGEFARKQAAEAPERTVGAAKSWLGHSKVDRHNDILPWNAPDEVPRVSPVTASSRYLQHMVAAWEQQFPDAPLKDQHVVLTVPASFDASARELTHEAALLAGLPENMVLLEEPQSAVYAWLATTGERWRKILQVGDRLLVCDVGGGTTDLTLVAVSEQDGELVLERVAVGRHLLIGGDNMDLALAHLVAGMFADKNVQLDPWQSVSLWHSCRDAKEALLKPNGPKQHPISVLGRGSKLVGGTVSVKVEREGVSDLLVEGFFPACSLKDAPARQRSSGFQEIGLPFESEPAITRHVAAFLRQHAESEGQAVQPTQLLLNGGVFKAEALGRRLREVIGSWFKKSDVKLLEGNHDLDHAVAKGAAYYGWTKQHGGMRIRGGTARASYIGIETAGLAVPGAPRPLRALCVVPIGMEEGTETDVPSEEIGLVVGESAHFRFFSSSTRKEDRPGDALPRWTDEELVETDSMEATLPAEEGVEDEWVPVKFHSKITELGMLELWCISTRDGSRWKLEFSVRDDAEA